MVIHCKIALFDHKNVLFHSQFCILFIVFHFRILTKCTHFIEGFPGQAVQGNPIARKACAVVCVYFRNQTDPTSSHFFCNSRNTVVLLYRFVLPAVPGLVTCAWVPGHLIFLWGTAHIQLLNQPTSDTGLPETEDRILYVWRLCFIGHILCG